MESSRVEIILFLFLSLFSTNGETLPLHTINRVAGNCACSYSAIDQKPYLTLRQGRSNQIEPYPTENTVEYGVKYEFSVVGVLSVSLLPL